MSQKEISLKTTATQEALSRQEFPLHIYIKYMLQKNVFVRKNILCKLENAMAAFPCEKNE